jgi:hypothetical protein
MLVKKSFKRIKSLLVKSATIQLKIEQESRKKAPDWVKLLMLKKQRLIVKDALHRLMPRRKKAFVPAKI